MHDQMKAATPGAGSHAGMDMKARSTGPQLAAVTLLTLLALAGGVLLGALFGDFRMSARNMEGMAGMARGGSGMGEMAGMGGVAGHDMSPVDTSRAPEAAWDARGNQPLTPRLDGGVKEFRLTAGLLRWSILPDVQVGAYAYNGQVPGPEIRLTQGDRARFVFTNELPEPTTVHWHGQQIANEQDGAADVTQAPILPGETYTYEFEVPEAGTFFYHTHFEADRQQALGLYGAFIVEPRDRPRTFDKEYTLQLGEWRVTDGQTFPAMELDSMLPNFFTINGKAYPATERLAARVGERVRLRFIGTGQFVHPMHLHGQPFKIVETDGFPVPEAAQLTKDTVLVGPGERYDVEFVARAPGKWLLHCHINHHITNDGAEVNGGGGLTMIVDVSP